MMTRHEGLTDEQRRSKFGTAKYQNDRIVYRSGDTEQWSIAIQDIAAIGEYTNENGPFAPDYFYVFVTWTPEWYELPYDAFGCPEAMVEIGEQLDFEPTSRLIMSSDFESVLVWPQHAAGKPLFQFCQEPVNWWHRLWPPPVQVSLSDTALEIVRQGGGQSPPRPG